MKLSQILETLRQATKSEPDTKGEHWITCPNCGKEPSGRSGHCSFSEYGWHCFACSEGGTLVDLLKRLGAMPAEPFRYKPKKKKAVPRSSFEWQRDATQILRTFEEHSDREALWRNYRPFRHDTVQRWHLGVGTLPNCRCRHERLVYPAFDARGHIIAFRGRAFCCDCKKWLQSAGSRVTLWGGSLLKWRARQTVIIAEAPPDGMLAMQEESGVVAVASTGGAGTWRDSWTQWIAQQEPELVIVWYDNDLSGQPTAETQKALAAEWFKEHPKAKKLPRQNGPHVYNQLARAKLPVVLYQWPKGTPPKQDLSAELMEKR